MFGFTHKNEITNGRWVMFGFVVGMMTEYATGVDFIHQLEQIVSYTGALARHAQATGAARQGMRAASRPGHGRPAHSSLHSQVTRGGAWSGTWFVLTLRSPPRAKLSPHPTARSQACGTLSEGFGRLVATPLAPLVRSSSLPPCVRPLRHATLDWSRRRAPKQNDQTPAFSASLSPQPTPKSGRLEQFWHCIVRLQLLG